MISRLTSFHLNKLIQSRDESKEGFLDQHASVYQLLWCTHMWSGKLGSSITADIFLPIDCLRLNIYRIHRDYTKHPCNRHGTGSLWPLPKSYLLRFIVYRSQPIAHRQRADEWQVLASTASIADCCLLFGCLSNLTNARLQVVKNWIRFAQTQQMEGVG